VIVSYGDEAIFVDAKCWVSFLRDNFTACMAVNSGSSFHVYNEDSEWSVSYLTLVSLTGDTGIESNCKSLSTLDFCDIYNNTLDEDWGVLYSTELGWRVMNMIF
jgi:hypothetical protein